MATKEDIKTVKKLFGTLTDADFELIAMKQFTLLNLLNGKSTKWEDAPDITKRQLIKSIRLVPIDILNALDDNVKTK